MIVSPLTSITVFSEVICKSSSAFSEVIYKSTSALAVTFSSGEIITPFSV